MASTSTRRPWGCPRARRSLPSADAMERVATGGSPMPPATTPSSTGGTGHLRPARPRVPGHGGHRQPGVPVGRARRRGRARRGDGPRAGGGVHEPDLPVPGPGRSRRPRGRGTPRGRSQGTSTARPGLVALAAVQSADGAVAPLDEVEAACARHGVDVLVDLTQATGWRDVDASRFAVHRVCGVQVAAVSSRNGVPHRPRRTAGTRWSPSAAGWYAGAEPWSSIYGLPLRLAADARRFDVSPGWHSWVGTEASLDLLDPGRGAGRCEAHARALRGHLRAGGRARGRGPGDPGAGCRLGRSPGILAGAPCRRVRAGGAAARVLPRPQHRGGGGTGRSAAAGARHRLSPWWAGIERTCVGGHP